MKYTSTEEMFFKCFCKKQFGLVWPVMLHDNVNITIGLNLFTL